MMGSCVLSQSTLWVIHLKCPSQALEKANITAFMMQHGKVSRHRHKTHSCCVLRLCPYLNIFPLRILNPHELAQLSVILSIMACRYNGESGVWKAWSGVKLQEHPGIQTGGYASFPSRKSCFKWEPRLHRKPLHKACCLYIHCHLPWQVTLAILPTRCATYHWRWTQRKKEGKD